MYKVLPGVVLAALLSNSPATAAPSHPSCSTPDETAKIDRFDPPEFPYLAKILDLTGTATVRIDLSPAGDVLGAYLVKSAGSPILDEAAVQYAKTIVYAPETHSCEPNGGSYAVQIEYTDP